MPGGLYAAEGTINSNLSSLLEVFDYFTDTLNYTNTVDCWLREMSNSFSQAITILSSMVCVFCHSIISHFSLKIGSISSLVQPGIIHTPTLLLIVVPHSHPSMPRPVLPTPISIPWWKSSVLFPVLSTYMTVTDGSSRKRRPTLSKSISPGSGSGSWRFGETNMEIAIPTRIVVTNGGTAKVNEIQDRS